VGQADLPKFIRRRRAAFPSLAIDTNATVHVNPERPDAQAALEGSAGSVSDRERELSEVPAGSAWAPGGAMVSAA